MIRAAEMLGDTPSIRQAFLCRHNVQVPRITRELKPFAVALLIEFHIRHHHSIKEGSAG
jgi:hypothetical protein